MDGVNSMTGNPPRLAEFAALARAYDATLYVDDGHGFGVVGERSREEPCPYGRRGNGVVRHLGEGYDNVVLTAGFSKAYSSLLAFIACPTPIKRLLKITAAAVPVLRAVPGRLTGQHAARACRSTRSRGDELRAMLYGKTRRVLDHLREAGRGHPEHLVVPDHRGAAGRRGRPRPAWARCCSTGGSTRPWPSTRASRGTRSGSGSSSPSANTGDQVDELLVVLDELADRGLLRTGALS